MRKTLYLIPFTAALILLTLVGVAGAELQTVTFTDTPNLSIPDATMGEFGPETPTPLQVDLPREVVEVEVYFDLVHQFSSDMRMWVESPQGTRILLFFIGEGGEPGVDPAGWYPVDFTPAEDMGQWIGEPMEGTWNMIWQDLSFGEPGTLLEWRLRLTYDDSVAADGETWSEVKALFN